MRDNIRYGRPEADEAALLAAVRAAKADGFLARDAVEQRRETLGLHQAGCFDRLEATTAPCSPRATRTSTAGARHWHFRAERL